MSNKLIELKNIIINILVIGVLASCSSTKIDSSTLPSDVPLRTYPNAKPDEYKTSLGTKSVVYSTTSDSKIVKQWYLDELRANGWSVEQASEKRVEVLRARKNDKLVEIMIMSIVQPTAIILTWK